MTKAIILDTETTGLSKPEPIEVAYIELKEFSREPIKTTNLYEEKFYPPKPIDPRASKVHGMYMKDLIGKRKSHEFEMPECSYIIGHNIKFDMRVLKREDDILICTKELAVIAFQEEKKSGELKNHKLTTLVEFLFPKEGKLMIENAHSALQDCMLVLAILPKILEKLEIANSWQDMANLCSQMDKNSKNTKKKIVEMKFIPFGKYQGKIWEEVPKQYLEWLSKQSLDLSVEVAVRKELKRRC